MSVLLMKAANENFQVQPKLVHYNGNLSMYPTACIWMECTVTCCHSAP